MENELQTYKIVCPTGYVKDTIVYDPNGEEMSGVKVVDIRIEAGKRYAVATIRLAKVVVDADIVASEVTSLQGDKK